MLKQNRRLRKKMMKKLNSGKLEFYKIDRSYKKGHPSRYSKIVSVVVENSIKYYPIAFFKDVKIVRIGLDVNKLRKIKLSKSYINNRDSTVYVPVEFVDIESDYIQNSEAILQCIVMLDENHEPQVITVDSFSSTFRKA